MDIPSLEQLAVPITAPITPGPPDIIPGFLPRQGQLVLAGETDVGKSLTALEVCSSLTTGTPLWGHLEPALRARRILYVLGEHYDEVIQRLWRKTKLPMTDQVFLLGPEKLGSDKWLMLSGRPNVPALTKFKRWAEGCDLVVFDPLAAFIVGTDVENDNNLMRILLDSMSGITQAVGASCLVLAHQGKPTMDRFGNEHTRTRYAIRGASSIEDAATNIFYLGRGRGDSESAEQLAGKVFAMTKRKYKGTAPDEYLLLRDPETLTHRILGGARPYVHARRQALAEQVAELESGGTLRPDAMRQVAASAGLSERSVRRALVPSTVLSTST